MARQESDREDLMKEATGFPCRAIFRLMSNGEELFVGKRDGGSVSIYVGTEIVFQFNAAKSLRRVFYFGRKFAAENGELVELERTDSIEDRIQLSRRKIDQSLLIAIQGHWDRLLKVISDQTDLQFVESIPASNRTPCWFNEWISTVASDLCVASKPNAS